MIGMILSVISGALLILAFPKPDLYPLAYVALVPFFFSIRRARTKWWALCCGMLFGMTFISGYLFWINVLSRWAGFWTYIAWVGLFIFQGAFFAVFALLYHIYFPRFKRHDIIAVPLLWSVIEWIRSIGPYGVTGGDLCYSQVQLIPLIQIAAFASCYAVSFLVVMVNEAIVELIEEKRIAPLLFSLFLLIIVLTYGLYRVNSYRDAGRPVKIAVIQGNVSQDVKLDFGLAYEIVAIHDSMSRKAIALKPDIVVWPETAVTTYLMQTKQILASIKSLIRSGRAYYLIGTPYRDGEKIYNSVIAFSGAGEVIGRYNKQRLVPFGEYLPLRPVMYKILAENPLFSEDYNSDPNPQVIDIGIAKVGTVICFESTFPYIVRDKVRRGAQFILVDTNDAWFFDSAAVYQHLQAAQIRAVESNMYVVQAANTGISAVIDPRGRIVKRTNVGESAVLIGEIYVH